MEQLLHRMLTSVGQFGDSNPEVRGAALLGLSTLIVSSIAVKLISKLRGKKEVEAEKKTVKITVEMPEGQSIKIDSN